MQDCQHPSTQCQGTQCQGTHSAKVHSAKVHSAKVHSAKVHSTQVHSAKVQSLDVTLHNTQIPSLPTVPHVVALDQYIGPWPVVVFRLRHQPVPLAACKWQQHFNRASKN